jgi:DNA ligase (NAD+)
MNEHQAERRVVALRAQINRHNHLYYVEARPEISDREYDDLYRELQDLEAQFPGLVTRDSPTQRVGGAPLKEFRNVRHRVPMLSLEKAYSLAPVEGGKRGGQMDLLRFDARIRRELPGEPLSYVLEPKVDGVSITLHYDHGRLVLAATRGDGTTGDDVTQNARTIRGIPLELQGEDPPEFLEVRGEVYMDRDGFRKLNAELEKNGEDPFPNPRNATAGSLKQLDPRVVARRPLNAVFYGVGQARGIAFERHSGTLQALKALGLPTPRLWWVCASIAEAAERTAEIYARRDELPYEVDGSVIKIDDMSLWARLGKTATHPGYAIAYKPRDEAARAVTRLLAVTVQVGRSGTLTPVAELEPVFLDGTTISRATLHNADDIRRKDIRIGDTVVIERAGKVIPAVVEAVIEKRPVGSTPFDLESHINGRCPECGGPVKREEGFVAWRCENLQCPAQNTRRIEYFSSRAAMDIEGLGGIVAEKIVESGLAVEPLDLFRLELDPLAKLNLGTAEEPRIFGEKNALKVIQALDRARTAPLDRWLGALGIPHVGKTIAYALARAHRDLADVAGSKILRAIVDLAGKTEELRRVNPDSRSNPPKTAAERAQRTEQAAGLKKAIAECQAVLAPQSLPEVGPVVARSVLDFFASRAGRAILGRLDELKIHPRSEGDAAASRPAAGPFAGKAFVLTGTLGAMSRDAATDEIRKRGGTVTGAVSGKTQGVIAGQDPGANKIADARKHGVRIISEPEFLAMLGLSAGAGPADRAPCLPGL